MTLSAMRRPSVPARLLAAAGVALACMVMLAFDRVAAPDSVPDFDHVWFAATALLQHRDPYLLIGPGLEFNWPWPLYYPLTAPVSILPLGYLPLTVARTLFVAAPAALLAFLLTRESWGRLALFASGAFLVSVKTAQWGPWVLCSLLVPWLGFFCAAKPNLGFGALAGARTWAALVRMLAGASLLLVSAFVLHPKWLTRWLEVVASAPQPLSMLTLAGGPILLLAVLRWRRWEARMLLLFALVPQTAGAVGTLPLMLIPRSFRSLLVLGILSYVPIFLAPQAGQTIEHWARRETFASLLAVYLPALWLVLKLPNAGPLPARLESLLTGWPAWVRGVPGPATDPVSMDLESPTGVPVGDHSARHGSR